MFKYPMSCFNLHRLDVTLKPDELERLNGFQRSKEKWLMTCIFESVYPDTNCWRFHVVDVWEGELHDFELESLHKKAFSLLDVEGTA